MFHDLVIIPSTNGTKPNFFFSVGDAICLEMFLASFFVPEFRNRSAVGNVDFVRRSIKLLSGLV
jgi:hypothetical protein